MHNVLPSLVSVPLACIQPRIFRSALPTAGARARSARARAAPPPPSRRTAACGGHAWAAALLRRATRTCRVLRFMRSTVLPPTCSGRFFPCPHPCLSMYAVPRGVLAALSCVSLYLGCGVCASLTLARTAPPLFPLSPEVCVFRAQLFSWSSALLEACRAGVTTAYGSHRCRFSAAPWNWLW